MRYNLMWAMTKNKIHLQSIVNKRQTTPCSPPHRETNVLTTCSRNEVIGHTDRCKQQWTPRKNMPL